MPRRARSHEEYRLEGDKLLLHEIAEWQRLALAVVQHLGEHRDQDDAGRWRAIGELRRGEPDLETRFWTITTHLATALSLYHPNVATHELVDIATAIECWVCDGNADRINPHHILVTACHRASVGVNTLLVSTRDRIERTKQSTDQDAEYAPAGWFQEHTQIPPARLRQAATPGRSGKKVRKKTLDGVVCYSAADARKWWPHDMRRATPAQR